jgi:hypothetical protein
MVNDNVVGVELGSATWWRGFHLGYAGFGRLGQGWVFGVKTSISLSLNLFISLQRNRVFCNYLIFLLQAYMSASHWLVKKA